MREHHFIFVYRIPAGMDLFSGDATDTWRNIRKGENMTAIVFIHWIRYKSGIHILILNYRFIILQNLRHSNLLILFRSGGHVYQSHEVPQNSQAPVHCYPPLSSSAFPPQESTSHFEPFCHQLSQHSVSKYTSSPPKHKVTQQQTTASTQSK